MEYMGAGVETPKTLTGLLLRVVGDVTHTCDMLSVVSVLYYGTRTATHCNTLKHKKELFTTKPAGRMRQIT